MSNRTLNYLKSILDAIEVINTYSEADMPGNARYDAMIYRLATIGEACNQLPEDLHQRYPEVPWREIINCRNILIHNYLGVDTERIDDILEKNLGELHTKITAIIDEYEN